MKYIISNTQLYKVMMDYLNDFLNNNIEHQFDTFIIIGNMDEYGENLDVVMEHDSYDNRLYINKSFLETFSNWFPLDIEDSMEFIKDWFEWKFGVNIDKVEY